MSSASEKVLANSVAGLTNLLSNAYRPIADEISADLLDASGRIRVNSSVPRDELWIVQGRIVVAKIVNLG